MDRKVFNFYARFVFIIFIISCNSSSYKQPKSTDTISKEVNNLSGHVYYFGPAIDSAEGKILAECDCCTDDILFLNEKDFVRIGNCLVESDVTKGTYLMENKKIILQYNSPVYHDENDGNNEIKTINKQSKQYLIKSKDFKPFEDTILQFEFSGKIFYQYKNENLYGKISPHDSIQTYINDLRDKGFWQKLDF